MTPEQQQTVNAKLYTRLSKAQASLAAPAGYAACVEELFALSVEADETLRACKEQGDDEGRIEHRGRRDAYNHALEIVKRHNVELSEPPTKKL